MAVAGVIVVLICSQNRGVGFTVVEGVPLGRAGGAGPARRLDHPAEPDPARPLHLRDRRERRGGAPGGLNLSRIRVTAFALCGLTAGITGIIYASNLGSMSNNFNGGQYVLYAVAAAVIGGTSLFGGRGRMLGAVLGGLVVGVIYNGLTLLGLGAAAQYIWTALVLLAAVVVDSLARRGSTPT